MVSTTFCVEASGRAEAADEPSERRPSKAVTEQPSLRRQKELSKLAAVVTGSAFAGMLIGVDEVTTTLLATCPGLVAAEPIASAIETAVTELRLPVTEIEVLTVYS